MPLTKANLSNNNNMYTIILFNLFSFDLVGFYGILTILVYLMPNPLYTNIKYIWFGWVLWHINRCRLFNAKSVATLLGLISSAHRNLHNWRSNRQPQYTETTTLPLGHRFMSHISDAELTSNGDNARPLDLMCIEGKYILYIKYII